MNMRKINILVNKIGAILIFDEVTSGFRMNVGGVHLKFGINPDILVLGKGISNGYPMSAVIGKKDVMDAAQTSFISSTYWTERVGSSASIATIKKMQKFNIPAHLNKIGGLIGKGWKKLADKHGLDIEIIPPNALITISFNYENAQEIKTLFTQEMLKRGYLATFNVYVSYCHTEKHVNEYLNKVDEVFGIIKQAIIQNNVKDLLEGPVAHSGFQRLT